MNRQNATERISVLDSLPITLELLRALAISVLHEHAAAARLCVVCRSAWPCERVVLASHNLADVT